MNSMLYHVILNLKVVMNNKYSINDRHSKNISEFISRIISKTCSWNFRLNHVLRLIP